MDSSEYLIIKMHKKHVTLEGFADMLKNDTVRGIVDGDFIMELIKEVGIPKSINDTRGDLRMIIEFTEGGLDITEYTTDLVKEKIGEIY